jgi:cytochrome P450 family 4
MNLLDILLKATVDGEFLTNEDIREEIDTFMFEVKHESGNYLSEVQTCFHCQGHDTTNSALAFTLFNIAKHQHIQQKCFDEICEVVGSDKDTSVEMK